MANAARKQVDHDDASPTAIAARKLRRRRAGDRFVHGVRIPLAGVRQACSVTQVELAAATTLDQTAISQVEHREDALVSTLRRYAEGLGGTLEVTMVIRGHRYIVEIGQE